MRIIILFILANKKIDLPLVRKLQDAAKLTDRQIDSIRNLVHLDIPLERRVRGGCTHTSDIMMMPAAESLFIPPPPRRNATRGRRRAPSLTPTRWRATRSRRRRRAAWHGTPPSWRTS